MPVSKEAVDRIINFRPDEGRELGEIGGGLRLVYDILPYQQRAVVLPGEPLVSTWTKQPVLALESRDKEGKVTVRRPLVYTTDVLAIGDLLAEQVLDRITALQERSRVTA